jgi:nicotinamide-nucleotide amidase
MASLITSVPGASAYFLGSIVCYADALKHDLLHVPEKLLKEKGAVSREVVNAMLQGLFTITKADYGIAVSGIAGHTGGSAEKPVGTIWAAIGARSEDPKIFTFRAEGKDREAIIVSTCRHLFCELEMILT